MKAAILAGGVGTRMRPLTYVVPKVMLPIGGRPLLERTITHLKSYGFKELVVCVAYLKNQIMDYFKEGEALGVTIEYAEADRPLGTAGQLKTAERLISDAFLCMNGDIVTSMNIGELVNSHRKGGGIGTIALKKFEVQIPYGYIQVNNDFRISRFQEKPTLSYLANAGVYVFERRIFDHIPANEVKSLETDIFPELLGKGEKLNGYYEDAYWADVGNMSDFERTDRELSLIHI